MSATHREWLEGDDALRARARVLAAKLQQRARKGIYRTLKNFSAPLLRDPYDALRGLRDRGRPPIEITA